jgi:Domain of unknown function (DUF4386)
MMMSVDAFHDGWTLALAVFGAHLLVLGYLIVRAAYLPRLLGIVVVIASLGYLIDSFGGSLWKGYHAELTRYTSVGEVLLMGWLLWKGRRLQEATPSVGRSAAAASRRHGG